MLDLPISTFAAALTAAALTALSLNVSRLRMRHRIALGDGGNKVLATAIRAHANLLEQGLLFVALLLIAEAQGLNAHILLGASVVFGVARALHAFGMLGRRLGLRQTGHIVTLLAQIALIAVLFVGMRS